VDNTNTGISAYISSINVSNYNMSNLKIDDLEQHRLTRSAGQCLLMAQRLIMPLALVVVSFSLSSYGLAAQLDFLIPEDFDIKFVNGEDYKAPLFQTKTIQTVAVSSSAQQQIVLVYSQVFDDGEDFDVVKSKPFMLEFKTGKTADITIAYKVPNDYDSAKAFAKKPELDIVQAGVSLGPTLSYDVDRRSWLESFVAPRQSAPVTNEPAEFASINPGAKLPDSDSALAQLFFWWNSASVSERDTFLQHISTPDTDLD
jgi:uncharacterized protein YccT (UPF0319 family)